MQIGGKVQKNWHPTVRIFTGFSTGNESRAFGPAGPPARASKDAPGLGQKLQILVKKVLIFMHFRAAKRSKICVI